jgi:hypothetical protein
MDTVQVREALSAAHLVASILPSISPRERQRRATMQHDLSMGEALDRYLENRPDLESHSQSLRQLADQLEHDLDMQGDQG